MPTGKRVLIVEDEVLIALDMEIMLKELGHAVEIAQSIASANSILAAMEIDIAILGYQLQDDTAVLFATKLTALHVPYIVCSGTAGLEELAEAYRGAPTLAKPFTRKVFLEVVTRAASSDHRGHDGGHRRRSRAV